MNYVILALLLCIPSLSFARSWEESFAEAAKQESRAACLEVESRMYFKCDSASCYARSQRLKDECIETVEEAIAEKKEEKAQKKREEEEKKARRDEVDYVVSIMRLQPTPDIELSCKQTRSSRENHFDRFIELKIWNKGVCSGTYGHQTCDISTAQYAGMTRSRSWVVDRATGEMSLESLINSDLTAEYQCQKVSAATNKF